jgi:hypothetical protein
VELPDAIEEGAFRSQQVEGVIIHEGCEGFGSLPRLVGLDEADRAIAGGDSGIFAEEGALEAPQVGACRCRGGACEDRLHSGK